MKDFTPTPLGALAQQGKNRSYAKGQIMYYQGEVPESVSIIKSGVVKVYNLDEEGREKILHLLKGGTVCPISALLGKDSHTEVFYGTLTACQLSVIAKEDFQHQLSEQPEMAGQLLRWLASETEEMLVRLASLENSSTSVRLYAALRYLAIGHAFTRSHGWHLVDFPVSQQLLASLVGATRPSVTTALKEFQQQKIIRYPRSLRLEINIERLLASA